MSAISDIFLERRVLVGHGPALLGEARRGMAWFLSLLAWWGVPSRARALPAPAMRGMARLAETIFLDRNGGAVQGNAGLGKASSGWPWSGAPRRGIAWPGNQFSRCGDDWRADAGQRVASLCTTGRGRAFDFPAATRGLAGCGEVSRGKALKGNAPLGVAPHGVAPINEFSRHGNAWLGVASLGSGFPGVAMRGGVCHGLAARGRECPGYARQGEARLGFLISIFGPDRSGNVWPANARLGTARYGMAMRCIACSRSVRQGDPRRGVDSNFPGVATRVGATHGVASHSQPGLGVVRRVEARRGLIFAVWRGLPRYGKAGYAMAMPCLAARRGARRGHHFSKDRRCEAGLGQPPLGRAWHEFPPINNP